METMKYIYLIWWSYEYRDGIHIYPLNWFMYEWHNSEFGLNWNYERLIASFQSVVRNSLHKLIPGWVSFKTLRLKQRMKRLQKLKEKWLDKK